MKEEKEHDSGNTQISAKTHTSSYLACADEQSS
jgi:hypothetical protein